MYKAKRIVDDPVSYLHHEFLWGQKKREKVLNILFQRHFERSLTYKDFQMELCEQSTYKNTFTVLSQQNSINCMPDKSWSKQNSFHKCSHISFSFSCENMLLYCDAYFSLQHISAPKSPKVSS